MNIPFILYLLFIVAPIGTFLHEMGHALGAKLAKADTIVLSIGSGKEAITLSISNVKIKIHRLFFIGGYTKSSRYLTYTKQEICLIAVWGPILNGISAMFLFWLLKQYVSNDYVYILFLFNMWLAFINIIPFKIGNKHSDGYTIFRAMTNRHL